MSYKLFNADILEWDSDELFHACLCDPPYHLTSITKRFGKNGSAPAQYGTDGVYGRHSSGFMGEKWDGGEIAFRPETWELIGRHLLPGAYLLAFGGTRTQHRLICAIEDAGFIIYDLVAWVYGQGFAKSHNLHGTFEGYGTALKPAMEVIVIAKKPVEGTIANNCMKYGSGALNIDGCRIPGEPVPINKLEEWSGFGELQRPDYVQEINKKGRWPANLILSYPEDEYILRDDVTPNQLHQLAEWINENS